MELTLENMRDFEDGYTSVDQAAKKLFDSIEALEHRYKNGYRDYYEYDNFCIECGYITLEGSYSYRGNGGKSTYDLKLESFANLDAYLEEYEAKLIEKQQERKRAADARADQKEKEEFEQYMKLKAKFESKNNASDD